MKLRFLSVATLLLMGTGCPGTPESDIVYFRTSWDTALVHVVSINLNSPDSKVTVALARNGAGTSESFTSMLNRLRPSVAITGTFFCTRSLLPTGDIVIEGIRVHEGSLGTGVCFTPANTIEFVSFRQGHNSVWQGYKTVLCAGPRLVRNGALSLAPRAEGFTDPALFGNKKRTALGVTEGNRLLLVVVETPVYLRTLAKIMLHLGAVDAVDLDGGSSSALYCDGRVITRPKRKLTNLLVVYDNPTRYYAHRQGLAPQFRQPIIAAARSTGDLNQLEAYLAEALAFEIPKPASNDFDQVAGYHMEWLTDSESSIADGWQTTPAEQQTEAQLPESALNTENRLLPVPALLAMRLLPRPPYNCCRPTADTYQKCRSKRLTGTQHKMA